MRAFVKATLQLTLNVGKARRCVFFTKEPWLFSTNYVRDTAAATEQYRTRPHQSDAHFISLYRLATMQSVNYPIT